MVADRGLGPAGWFDEVARAHLACGGIRDQAEELQSDRVSQDLESCGELFGIVPIERFREDRFATCLDRRHTHESILSIGGHIDVRQSN